ncbi:hypothetical protein [Actinoplanes sp. CA-252034]|uniref:hypothetical protein n=1 Tax=Actinoplanes sp. CA-252034 TaxID=3239906 RepID=UPI003D968D81
MEQTLGVLAHRGGLIADRPELTVGVVQVISRPTGLDLELIARRPLDRRSAAERQADIRAGRPGPEPAARRLLPRYDEGLDLRVGRLDDDGRAHWQFAVSSSSASGDHSGGVHGPWLRMTVRLPPLFDRLALVLAWPEIGFPETVVELPLPDRATVDRDTVSVWDAPVRSVPPPAGLRYRTGSFPADEPYAETGRIVVPPRVLARSDDAVVVLSRLTEVGDSLSLELACLANAYIPPGPSIDTFAGAAVAVVRDGEATWISAHTAGAGGGVLTFQSTAEYTITRPPGDVLPLLISWPAADLPDAYVDLPLDYNEIQ